MMVTTRIARRPLRKMPAARPTPKAMSRKDILKPIEQPNNSNAPRSTVASFSANVRIAPSVALTQGDQPAPKKKPINADER